MVASYEAQAGFGNDPCAYLNDAGTGVESVDQNSSPGECQATGGQWIPTQPAGTIYGVDSNGNAYAYQPFNANAAGIFLTVSNSFPGWLNANPSWNERQCAFFDWASTGLGLVGISNADNPIGGITGISSVGLWAISKLGNC